MKGNKAKSKQRLFKKIVAQLITAAEGDDEDDEEEECEYENSNENEDEYEDEGGDGGVNANIITCDLPSDLEVGISRGNG